MRQRKQEPNGPACLLVWLQPEAVTGASPGSIVPTSLTAVPNVAASPFAASVRGAETWSVRAGHHHHRNHHLDHTHEGFVSLVSTIPLPCFFVLPFLFRESHPHTFTGRACWRWPPCPCPFVLFALCSVAMGSSQSSVSSTISGAQFVSDGLPAVQSYRRCHIFGDSSLYSVGIRTGYYLQYLAAVLSILFLHGQDLRLWFLSFVPLVVAHFVVLIINAAGPGLVVLDWEIVFGLVFWSFAFLARSIFYRAVPRPHAGSVRDSRKLQQDLSRECGRSISDQEVEWDKRYIVMIKVLGTEASQMGSGGRQAALHQALEEYVGAFASARVAPGYGEAANYILDLYDDGDRVRDIVGRMMISNTEVESFRDAHAEALRRANVGFDQAQSTTHTLAKTAMEELYPGTHGRSPRSAAQVVADFETWGGTAGMLGFGLALVLYAGYLGFTIWVLFRGVDHGRKNGCDVRVIFFVVPVSIYNRAALTALRVLACIWLAVAGVPALLGGIAFLAIGLSSWWTEKSLAFRASTGKMKRDDTSGFKAVAYDAEKGKGPVGTGTRLTSVPQLPGVFRGSRASDTFFETSEFPTQPSTSSFKKETEGGLDDLVVEENTGGGTIRGGGIGSVLGTAWIVVRSRWELVFLLPLAHTVVVVELTVHINRLDMRQRAFSSFGEFLAFFLGAFLLLRVLGRCLLAAKQERNKRKSARWFEERWRVLMDKPVRRGGGDVSGSGGSVLGGGGLEEPKSPASGVVKRESLQRISTWQTSGRQSVGSMGRFKEMIDEG